MVDVNKNLVEVRNLDISFRVDGKTNNVVHKVNFDIGYGETVAIVGESGSGKSTTAMALMQLLPGTGVISGGSIKIEGQEIVGASEKQMQKIRGKIIGLVPQDPMANLNPVINIGKQVAEALTANGFKGSRAERNEKVYQVLENAGLPEPKKRVLQYQHQFSGGMRQRALIAMGLAASPKLLIADEPTSALDVTVQKKILDHLAVLTSQSGTAVLFITHDLGLAAERAEKLIVMYRGKIVEAGPSLDILRNPQHAYTKKLVAAAPSIASKRLAVTENGLLENSKTKENNNVLIKVSDLNKNYEVKEQGKLRKSIVPAVKNVSFSVEKGTTTAIVGESGSGKSTIAKMILQLEEPTSGSIEFDGVDLASLNKKEIFKFRRKVQPVFQDPFGTLDPMYNLANTIAEPLVTHGIGTKKEQIARVQELLDQVSLPQQLISRYPNELSGGQRQRVSIARALALKPEVLILDEAVSALDVLVQSQILDLLAELQQELNLTYLFITHDLAVVKLIADNVCVMKKGEIVEMGDTANIFTSPKEQYTIDLLDAIPGAKLDLAF